MDDDTHQFSSAIRSEIIDAVINKLHTSYIFPAVAEDIALMLHQKQSRGDYDAMSEGRQFAEALTAHIQEVSNDSHLIISYESQEANSEGDPAFASGGRDSGALFNYGFEKVERMAGNIGYLSIHTFFPPASAFQAAITAMNFITHTYALIIDLRLASGGDLAMVRFFASYFFSAEPVHLHTLYARSSDRTRQSWTLPYIPGHRYADKPLYILTSRATSSTAEAFAYDLQSQHRATIVGETTAGEANPLERFPLATHFASWIPVEHITNPVTGTNWEGSGVRPDVGVAQVDALKTAYVLALKYVLQRNGHIQNSAQYALEKEIRAVLAQQ